MGVTPHVLGVKRLKDGNRESGGGETRCSGGSVDASACFPDIPRAFGQSDFSARYKLLLRSRYSGTPFRSPRSSRHASSWSRSTGSLRILQARWLLRNRRRIVRAKAVVQDYQAGVGCAATVALVESQKPKNQGIAEFFPVVGADGADNAAAQLRDHYEKWKPYQ